MKKSSLQTSLLLAMLLSLFSCHSVSKNTQQEPEESAEHSHHGTDGAIDDAMNNSYDEENQAAKKDSLSDSGKPKAIHHPSPNQEELDRIKEEKLKEKTGDE